ncbi:MAG: Mur ligase family protein [Candidatus Paceibacterota bacterium]
MDISSYLLQAKHIHFIGIGGIGVSAIARKFLLEKKIITGSDMVVSPLVKDLQSLGARIWQGHTVSHITKDVDVVIYTKAVSNDNPELVRAQELGIPTFTYSQALGIISADMYTIAVAGSHGKTTTTGMIAWGLLQAKKDPTVIVGSLLTDIPTNFIAGKSDYFVVEACEYGKSFLDLNPRIAVITNIDNDHLDYYKTKANLVKAFTAFAQKIPQNGYLITNLKDSACARIADAVSCHVIDYSSLITPADAKLIGDHNAMNMRAASAVLRTLHIPQGTIYKALASFSGTARRLEYKGITKQGMIIYDDYAHHPTEVIATLRAIRNHFIDKKIICVFQPHLYSRTKLLFKDFVKNFLIPDVLIILPIYAAREKKDPSISSQKLVVALRARRKEKVTVYADSCERAVREVYKHIDKDSLLITMGAGEAYRVGDAFLGKK